MTARPPRLQVHVDRVVLHGVPSVRPDVLATAIEAALVESLSGAAPAPGPHPQPAQVARAVAPAVLDAAGIAPGGRR